MMTMLAVCLAQMMLEVVVHVSASWILLEMACGVLLMKCVLELNVRLLW